MKKTIITLITALLASTAWFAIAQDEDRERNRRGGRGGGDFTSRLPLYKALDKDGNGELSAEEIANASKALRALDKDKDGKLSRDEIAPAFGRRGGGEGRERSERRRPSRPDADSDTDK